MFSTQLNRLLFWPVDLINIHPLFVLFKSFRKQLQSAYSVHETSLNRLNMYKLTQNKLKRQQFPKYTNVQHFRSDETKMI